MKKFRIFLICSSLLSILPSYTMNFEGNTDLLAKQFMGTSFRGGDLQGTSLVGQNLSEVDFRDTNLSGANLIGTVLINAKMNDGTSFSEAIGWEGTLRIAPGNKSGVHHTGKILPTISPVTGKQIKITKEWLIKQGVIFEN